MNGWLIWMGGWMDGWIDALIKLTSWECFLDLLIDWNRMNVMWNGFKRCLETIFGAYKTDSTDVIHSRVNFVHIQWCCGWINARMKKLMNVGFQYSDTNWRSCVGLLGGNPLILLHFFHCKSHTQWPGLKYWLSQWEAGVQPPDAGHGLLKND
jgi:hypothetical protein